MALDGNDSIDWGQLGPYIPNVNLPSNPEPVVSNGGLSVSADGYLDLGLGQQNTSTSPCSCWDGNFAPNDYLLIAGGAGASSLTLTFSTPVYGVGTQVGSDGPFGAFTGTMQLFDPLGNSLGSFGFTGDEENTADDSAIFVGALSSGPIGSVTISADYAFAVNSVDLVTPEPGSLFLMLAAAVVASSRLRPFAVRRALRLVPELVK